MGRRRRTRGLVWSPSRPPRSRPIRCSVFVTVQVAGCGTSVDMAGWREASGLSMRLFGLHSVGSVTPLAHYAPPH